MQRNRFNRRQLLKAGVPAGLSVLTLRHCLGREPQPLPAVRQITRPPKFHWFGYYDKLQFDSTNRYVLGMEVDFEHRSPRSDDVIKIGMIDLEDGDRWIELGQSTAWCWQQGCMLQWRPGSASEVLWNDREKDRYVCRLLDVKSGNRRTISHPVYALSPDGRWAIATDFRRLGDMRPGYGYAGLPDPYRDELAPPQSGIIRIDLETGRQELIVTLADVAKIPFPKDTYPRAKHWFNHLLINPDGTRIEFLNRCGAPEDRGHTTRMCTAAPDGSELRVLDQNGMTSHFIWRDPRHILAWSEQPSHGKAFYLLEDCPGGKVEVVGQGVMTGDGHCTYLPGNRWILCDTYPDRERKQHVYLYQVANGRRVPLGSFPCPLQYRGEWRCDTHPRQSRDGRHVVIDSPHTGQGRQMHLSDIGNIIG